MRKSSVVVLAAVLAPAVAFGTVVVNDDFSDLDRTKTGLLDADWWSSNSTSGNSVEIDASGLGLISGSSGRGIHATFAVQPLAIGDTIRATYAFTTPTSIGSNKGTSFRIALMDGTDPALADDLSSSSSSSNPVYVGLPGYMTAFDVATGGDEDVNFREHDITSSTGRFLGTTGEWLDMGSSPDAGYTWASNTAYVGVYSITRTGADSVELFSSMSQGGSLMDSHTETDSSGIANDYGMFAIWVNSNVFGSNTDVGDPDNGITLSNVTIEHIAIPEPSSAALLLGAFVAISIWRRRG